MKCDYLTKAIQKLDLKNIQNKQISKIGEGAWHNVYKIEREFEEDIVIRIKKKVAYGHLQEYKENDLISEYESTKVYYQYANKCYFNICPTFFDYYLDESLVFTIESFMGKGNTLQSLNHTESFSVGEKLGDFFSVMHSNPHDIKGFGTLKWCGIHLEGEIQKEANQIWQDDNDFYINVLKKLISTNLNFDTEIVADKILNIIGQRRRNQQRISLVNQDVTPENIILNLDNVSIIDPFPRLDFDLKYAGYFVFCYKFLLPAYSNAPRYRSSSYSQNANKMREIADGFIKGYTGNNVSLTKWIMSEYILWILLETYEHLEVLNEKDIGYKTLQQMGDEDIIKNRLIVCLKELENSCLTF